MACSACKRELKLVGRGLCAACYQRWYKRGTTEYAPKRERHKCQVPECEDFVVSDGLCDKHRKRLERHGHIEETRPDSWGAKGWGKNRRHPLYHSWMWMLRHRSVSAICEEWRNDFLQFVVDVGDRPGKRYKLFAADESRPIGPQNFVWKLSITQKVDGEDTRTYQARIQRVFRAIRKEGYKNTYLKRKFGLSFEQYEKMFADQDGRCAICDKQETIAIRGKTLALAVDHCHETGKVRGLLCSQCNQGIGCLKDSTDLLRKAAEYLETC